MDIWEYFVPDIEKLVRHEAAMLGISLDDEEIFRISVEAYYYVVSSEGSVEEVEKQLTERFDELVEFIRNRLLNILNIKNVRSLSLDDLERADAA